MLAGDAMGARTEHPKGGGSVFVDAGRERWPGVLGRKWECPQRRPFAGRWRIWAREWRAETEEANEQG